eukprot:gene4714-5161_t
MDGTLCSEPLCHVHDFLPFFCPRCHKAFCLAHRSRFSHTCQPDQLLSDEDSSSANNDEGKLGPSTEIPSVKKMMEDVEKRFSDQPASSDRQHFPIKASLNTASSLAAVNTQKKLNTLEEVNQKKGIRPQESSISRQTQRMLFKRRARGKESIAVDQRLYLALFDFRHPTTPLDYIYTASYAALGEVLRDLQPALLPRVGGKEGQVLAIATADSSWQEFDRSAPISSLLSSFEEVLVSVVSIEEVLEAQQKLRSSKLSKGALAWYFRLSGPPPVPLPTSVEEARLLQLPLYLVRIVAVHLDDLPNLYYTIQRVEGGLGGESSDFSGERQTDGSRLFPYQPPPSTSSFSSPDAVGQAERVCEKNHESDTCDTMNSAGLAGRVDREEQLLRQLREGSGPQWSLELRYKKNPPLSVIACALQPVALLRELAVLHFGLALKDTKLIYKGSTLKIPTATLQSCRLGDGAKIMVLG